MLTIDDLGLFTDLPDFCKGCLVSELTLLSDHLYAGNYRYITNTSVICEHIRICKALYERLKKEGKLKDEVTS